MAGVPEYLARVSLKYLTPGVPETLAPGAWRKEGNQGDGPSRARVHVFYGLSMVLLETATHGRGFRLAGTPLRVRLWMSRCVVIPIRTATRRKWATCGLHPWITLSLRGNFLKRVGVGSP